MKVKIAKIMAGPEGTFHEGSIVEVTKEEGEYLIQSGQANLVTEGKKKEAKPKDGEPEDDDFTGEGDDANGLETANLGEAGETTEGTEGKAPRERKGGKKGKGK